MNVDMEAECTDTWNNCNEYQDYCKASWFVKYYVDYCKKTCNKCPEPVKPACNAKDTAPTNIC
jgi:hypothetical protein